MHNYIFHILSNIRKLEHVQDETLRDQVIDELEIDLIKWRKFPGCFQKRDNLIARWDGDLSTRSRMFEIYQE